MLDQVNGLTSRLDGDDIIKAGLQGGEAANTLRLRFLVVPETMRGQPAQNIWRLILTPLDRHVHESLPIEVRGDAVMGISQKGTFEADIDLTRWEGYDFGVSRRHVQLRPSEKSLYVIDLNSTNGTHVNGLPIGPSWAHALSTGDILTLGMLNLRVTLLAMPRMDLISQLG